MSRPPRSRIVDMPMRTVYFKPSGKLPASAERVSLKFEELEALRLADLEGLSQSEASSGMGVSRHTFGRVLASARKKSRAARTRAVANPASCSRSIPP